MMAEQSMGMREYRKGNWTLQETMILIEAKKMDDERRKLTKKIPTTTTTTPTTVVSGSVVAKPVTELRWRWVEEYCWRKGCLRSQNQCNDKWDNLMRDYKKIRDFQKNLSLLLDHDHNQKSYWEMDKVERKDKSLPTNMLPQIYHALFDIVEHSPSTPTVSVSAPVPAPATATQFLLPPPVRRQSPPPPQGAATLLQLPTPSPPAPRLQQGYQLPYLLHTPTTTPLLESEASEHSHPESPAKRRRKEEAAAAATAAAAGEGTSTGAAATAAHQMAATAAAATAAAAPTSLQEVSSAICRSASMIAEAIQMNEEREERRHREMIHIHETRLRLEESKLEVTRQGFSSMTDAINNLANSILTLANNSNRTRPHGP